MLKFSHFKAQITSEKTNIGVNSSGSSETYPKYIPFEWILKM